MKIRNLILTAVAGAAALTTAACAELDTENLFSDDNPHGFSNSAYIAGTDMPDEGNNYKVVGQADFGDETDEINAALDASREAYENQGEAMPPRTLDMTPRPDGSQTHVLTTTDRAMAVARGRQDIPSDPHGWPTQNPKAHVHFSAGREYNGYFWNRSHLIADSLGGLPDVNNLIPGTRAQNVGDNQDPGGMAYTETIARNFLDDQLDQADKKPSTEAIDALVGIGITHTKKGNPLPESVDLPTHATCDVAYQAQPIYEPGEAIPRSVTVNIKTCDGSIDEQVEVPNTMPGYAINYATGDFRKQEG